MAFHSNPWRFLALAGAIHIALTITIFLVGHFQILPATFDADGIGLTFALDGTTYKQIATRLVDDWQVKGFNTWLAATVPFHSRLHSIFFATVGQIVGHNILAVEPLNLFLYLGIVSCIYLLGREIFDYRAGLLAAFVVGLWPSFLFHSTQLMRDSMAIFCFLALVLVLTLLLTREFAWRKGILLGGGGAIVVALFWVTRGNMWNVVLAANAIALVMFLLRMVWQKKFMSGNAIVIISILMSSLLVPSRLQSSTLPGSRPPATPFAIPSATQPLPAEGVWNRVIKQIADRRAGFRFFTSQASNIDPDVRFDSVGDILRFLPRAAVIGFFAPFPKMWIETGKFGRVGRLLSGLETLVMYFLYSAVAFCLWQERRNPRMWFLFLVAAIGIVGLGLVVINAGALYRIRYVFWMMLIVVAAQGVVSYLTVRRTRSTKA